ncbi:MAG TPA: NAD(P)-binding protein [Burkholderiales bacterium]|nr:NAD(P)-binding protein [Burkholderiales bacterium]
MASLMSPYTLAGRRLRNRLIHASMSTRMAQAAGVTDRLVDYYANRAKGGAALIVTEPLSMAQHQDLASRVRAFNDDQIKGLERWASAVEAHDCRLLGQIFERGRGRNLPGRNPDAIGASALPDDLSWTVPRALTAGEIEGLIEEFALSSARLQRCGFSGVELSAAHGHLFHQFLSPQPNVRTDRYGGDLRGRTRLVAELVAAIRARCGRDFIIGLKLPGDDGVAIGPKEAAAIAVELTRPGNVDYVCFAQGSHARSLEMHVPDGHWPRMPYLGLTRELRRAIPGVPVAAVGRITDPAEADALLQRGDAELVALGRALVTDPAWLLKAQAGRAHEIRHCVACNTCWDRITAQNLPIACDNNPRLAEPDEVDWRPKPARHKKRVVVVGAGLAGMEAAWVAAARGHEVIVFSRSRETGGKARLRARLPGGDGFANVFGYQLAQGQKRGVRIEEGVTAALADILALRPDCVVLAAGASMIPPAFAPSLPDLRTAIADVLKLRSRQAGTAVLYDMDHTEGTYAAAELLHERFERFVLVTPRDSIAQSAPLVTRQGILRRLSEKRVDLAVLSEVRLDDGFEEGRVQCVNVYNGDVRMIENVAFLSWSTPRAPEASLAGPLREAGIEVRVIGDCRSARGVLEATSEGHFVGNAIGED